MKTLTKTALIAVSVAALGSFSTAAYAAGEPATLPAGDTIYQASYSDEPIALWTTASDGTATLVGTPVTEDLFEVTDGAWNPVTGTAYIVGNGYEGPCELWSADLTTGAFTYIADITGDDGPTFNCDAFDIGPDGTAWVTMYDEGNTGVLTKLNLTDGTTTEPVALSGLDQGPSWIVVQPSTGVLFLGDWDTNLYTVNTTTGAATVVSAPIDLSSTYDAAFDSAGRLWITSWPDQTRLLSADVADFSGTIVEQGDIQIDGSGDDTGTDSLWIVRAPAPAPALADTGVDATLPLIAGLGLLLVGGIALVARRTRRA